MWPPLDSRPYWQVKENHQRQSFICEYSSSTLMNSPGRTVHLSPETFCFWAFLSDRSLSHSCQNWSCWRGSGAVEKEEPAMQSGSKLHQILHSWTQRQYLTFALSRLRLLERLFSLVFLDLFLECRWSFSSFSLAFTFSFSFPTVAPIASLFSSSIPIPSSSISPSSSSPSSLKSRMR